MGTLVGTNGLVSLPDPQMESLADGPEARIMLRRVPALLASVDPAVDHGVTLAGVAADAGARLKATGPKTRQAGH